VVSSTVTVILDRTISTYRCSESYSSVRIGFGLRPSHEFDRAGHGPACSERRDPDTGGFAGARSSPRPEH
jgi:hypothetical protein